MHDDAAFHVPHNDRRLALAADDDTVYVDYESDTNDPGNSLLIAAVIFCSCSLLCLPLLVKAAKFCRRRRKGRKRRNNDALADAEDDDDDSSEDVPTTILGRVMRRRRGRSGHNENPDRRRGYLARGRAKEARDSVARHVALGDLDSDSVAEDPLERGRIVGAADPRGTASTNIASENKLVQTDEGGERWVPLAAPSPNRDASPVVAPVQNEEHRAV